MLMFELLTIGSHADGDSVTLDLRGDVDLSTAPQLDEALREAERSDPTRLVLDCSGLDFIDSSGLAVLIDAERRATGRGHALILAQVPSHAERLLAMTGLSARFTVE